MVLVGGGQQAELTSLCIHFADSSSGWVNVYVYVVIAVRVQCNLNRIILPGARCELDLGAMLNPSVLW